MENLSPEVRHEAVERVCASGHELSREIDFRFPFQWSMIQGLLRRRPFPDALKLFLSVSQPDT
jgi:hypothetical protein